MNGKARAIAGAALVACAGCASQGASVQAKAPQKEKLHWEEGRMRFQPVEYALTVAASPFAVGEYFAFKDQSSPHWVGGIGFDEAARNAVRMRDETGLKVSWALADATGVTLVALVVGLDSVIVPLARHAGDVGWQLLAMDAESFTLSSILVISLYDTVGRARPYYQDCQANNGAVPAIECQGTSTASFPSGHINEAFTAAGLSCAHHLFAHVYGDRVLDALGCARDLTLATTEGLLRMMGDRHYLSDVLVGGAIGFSFGFALPTLLHYVKWPRKSPISSVWPAPIVGPDRAGLVLGGTF